MKPYQTSVMSKRKWKQLNLIEKYMLYIKPFYKQIFSIWCEPIPFSTSLKFVTSLFIGILIILPALYVFVLIICMYSGLQWMIQRYFYTF